VCLRACIRHRIAANNSRVVVSLSLAARSEAAQAAREAAAVAAHRARSTDAAAAAAARAAASARAAAEVARAAADANATTLAAALRVFGIAVDGGASPTAAQRAAGYKRAVLAFHPDRRRGAGVAEAARAEETFKLLSALRAAETDW
jgi:hypothetical protein